jgi:aspartate aminotransferase-like enzyme
VRSVTVTAIHVPEGINGDAIRKTLRVERGYVLGGGQGKLAGKIIRIGTMGDITQTDITGMLGALEMQLLEAGFPVSAGAAQRAALGVFLETSQPVPA